MIPSALLFTLSPAHAGPVLLDCGAAPVGAGTHGSCRDFFLAEDPDWTGDAAYCVTLSGAGNPQTRCKQERVLVFPVDTRVLRPDRA